MSEYTINTYPTGRVFLDEGWYTEEDLRKILDCIDRQNKHTLAMMGESK